MTVHRVLHIPSVTYRRYRETITHSSVYSLLFLLSLSLNRTKCDQRDSSDFENCCTWNEIPDVFQNFFEER